MRLLRRYRAFKLISFSQVVASIASNRLCESSLKAAIPRRRGKSLSQSINSNYDATTAEIELIREPSIDKLGLCTYRVLRPITKSQLS